MVPQEIGKAVMDIYNIFKQYGRADILDWYSWAKGPPDHVNGRNTAVQEG